MIAFRSPNDVVPSLIRKERRTGRPGCSRENRPPRPSATGGKTPPIASPSLTTRLILARRADFSSFFVVRVDAVAVVGVGGEAPPLSPFDSRDVGPQDPRR
jgi:hypothetical protein